MSWSARAAWPNLEFVLLQPSASVLRFVPARLANVELPMKQLDLFAAVPRVLANNGRLEALLDRIIEGLA